MPPPVRDAVLRLIRTACSEWRAGQPEPELVDFTVFDRPDRDFISLRLAVGWPGSPPTAASGCYQRRHGIKVAEYNISRYALSQTRNPVSIPAEQGQGSSLRRAVETLWSRQIEDRRLAIAVDIERQRIVREGHRLPPAEMERELTRLSIAQHVIARNHELGDSLRQLLQQESESRLPTRMFGVRADSLISDEISFPLAPDPRRDASRNDLADTASYTLSITQDEFDIQPVRQARAARAGIVGPPSGAMTSNVAPAETARAAEERLRRSLMDFFRSVENRAGEMVRQEFHQEFSRYIGGIARRADQDVGSKEARERGMKLLLESLTPEQRKSYEEKSHFEVVGGETKTRYRINHGRQMNICVLDQKGRRISGLCFLPQGSLVVGDVMLAQKIALESFELEALRIANRFG